MKIIFIVPQLISNKQTYIQYPMGVGYICTYLKKLKFSVKIVDQLAENILDDEIVNIIVDYEPDIIAYSILTSSYESAKNQLKIIKNKLPNVPVIAGGIHSTIFPNLLLNDGFDGIIIGEGEYEMQRICIAYKKYKMFLKSKQFIVSSKSKIPIIDINDEEIEKEVIKTELILDRSVYNINLYGNHSIITARGCPFSCKFCCNYKNIFGKYSIRKVESVIKELLELETKYNAREVFFADDIFFTNRKNIIKFCYLYKQFGLHLKWVAQLRVDIINEEIVTLMKNSGCYKICFGIESGSQEILDNANKKINLNQVEKAISETKKVGITARTWWIVGLPGSYTEQLKSVELMLKTRPNEISIHQFIPFPGTEYYNFPEKYGIAIKDKYNFSSFCYGDVGNNFTFDYLTLNEYNNILQIMVNELENVGYVSSDYAKKNDNYIYTLPNSYKPINVF